MEYGSVLVICIHARIIIHFLIHNDVYFVIHLLDNIVIIKIVSGSYKRSRTKWYRLVGRLEVRTGTIRTKQSNLPSTISSISAASTSILLSSSPPPSPAIDFFKLPFDDQEDRTGPYCSEKRSNNYRKRQWEDYLDIFRLDAVIYYKVGDVQQHHHSEDTR